MENRLKLEYFGGMLKSFNKIVYPYSKISRLPKILQTPALFIRNVFSSPPKYSFASDCMATSNNFFLQKLLDLSWQKNERLRQVASTIEYHFDYTRQFGVLTRQLNLTLKHRLLSWEPVEVM